MTNERIVSDVDSINHIDPLLDGIEADGNVGLYDLKYKHLVEIVITEEEAKQIADVLFYLIDKCNYSEETDKALISINNQIHNQIEYEPSKGT